MMKTPNPKRPVLDQLLADCSFPASAGSAFSVRVHDHKRRCVKQFTETGHQTAADGATLNLPCILRLLQTRTHQHQRLLSRSCSYRKDIDFFLTICLQSPVQRTLDKSVDARVVFILRTCHQCLFTTSFMVNHAHFVFVGSSTVCRFPVPMTAQSGPCAKKGNMWEPYSEKLIVP